VEIDGNSMLISQWFGKNIYIYITGLDINPKDKHPNLGNKRQAYKNPEWLGAPESRHIRIMYLGEALGLGKLSVESAVETVNGPEV